MHRAFVRLQLVRALGADAASPLFECIWIGLSCCRTQIVQRPRSCIRMHQLQLRPPVRSSLHVALHPSAIWDRALSPSVCDPVSASRYPPTLPQASSQRVDRLIPLLNDTRHAVLHLRHPRPRALRIGQPAVPQARLLHAPEREGRHRAQVSFPHNAPAMIVPNLALTLYSLHSQKFATLTANSPCTAGENACVNSQFAQCVNGKFVLTGCAGGLV